MVVNAVAAVIVIFLPTLLGAAAVATVRASRRMRRWHEGRHPHPVPMGPPIERLAADLRRLSQEQAALRALDPAPGRGLRTRALSAAYLDVLIAACRALEVAPPRGRGGVIASGEIARAEDDLRERGLDVGRT